MAYRKNESRKPPSSSRIAAFRAAMKAEADRIPVVDALEPLCGELSLEGRDRRLAEEILFGSVRHRRSLDLILRRASSRKLRELDSNVLEALRQGLYQLAYLSRIPDHAAITESVELVRLFAERRAVPFANAVLRSCQRMFDRRIKGPLLPENQRRAFSFRAGEHILVHKDLLPDPQSDLHGWLAFHYSYPRWLVQQLADSGDPASILVWGNEIPHLGVRINPLKSQLPESFTSDLISAGSIFEGCSGPRKTGLSGSWVIDPDAAIIDLPGLKNGLFTVQDMAQQVPADLLAPQPGEKILDLCAAPGGKSTHLAELSKDQAEILACDTDALRLEMVNSAARRLAINSITTRHLSDGHLPADLAGKFDVVLADVPCSNTGAMNRRVDSRNRATATAIRSLQPRQERILCNALNAAKPGGRVVYSTCSLLDEENRTVVNTTLRNRGSGRLITEKITLPLSGNNDGGYAALLEG
jgi:16S rRNA (cytosine967-C5)-methyltransferase